MNAWRALVGYEGTILVPEHGSVEPGLVYAGKLHRLLPACRTEDQLIAQPMLPTLLSEADLIALETSGPGQPIAVSCFGPPLQEKACNQDAAMSALLRDTDGQKYSFIVVADGVTTRTFWPERTARIACLTAYSVMRDYLKTGPFREEDVDEFRGQLTTKLREALTQDRERLLSSEVIPLGWDPELYKNYRDRLDLWYNSTLLVGCLGPSFGVVFWAGDGCVYVRRTGSESEADSAPLRSSDDLKISSFVNLADETKLSAGIIGYRSCDEVILLLGSDGFDRTVQRGNDLPLREFLGTRFFSDQARRALEQLWTTSFAESDNYSLALARWSLPVSERSDKRGAVSRSGNPLVSKPIRPLAAPKQLVTVAGTPPSPISLRRANDPEAIVSECVTQGQSRTELGDDPFPHCWVDPMVSVSLKMQDAWQDYGERRHQFVKEKSLGQITRTESNALFRWAALALTFPFLIDPQILEKLTGKSARARKLLLLKNIENAGNAAAPDPRQKLTSSTNCDLLHNILGNDAVKAVFDVFCQERAGPPLPSDVERLRRTCLDL